MGYNNLLLEVGQQKQLSKWAKGHHHVEGYRASIEKVYHSLSCKALITHIKDHSGWHKSSTSIQLYFSNHSNYKPKKGDNLLIRGRPLSILPSKRMPSTDLLGSLGHLSIYRHGVKQIDRDFMLLQPSRKWTEMIRQWCSHTLEKQLQNQQAIALVTTLLWGAKDHLNPDLQKAYADTGTMHVLAISGLHVGMLYLLIHTVFRFIFKKIGFLILSELLTLLLIWLYAALCHFSPPILRATIMITMARLGLLMGRTSNSYNGWFASAFVLLLWNPFVLFNCGFQLSYLATLGILYLQPYIHRLITPHHYWLQKIWTATTLSIAAQATTLPLMLYYFKQFSLYFIVANWLVVPAIFGILMLSLTLLVGSHLPIVATLLSFTVKKLIFATNELVCWMAKWPMSTIASSCINGRSACLLYIILLGICLFLEHKNFIYAITISLSTILHGLDRIRNIINKQKKCKMICYHNDQLSFTLKDGIEALNSNGSPSNRSLLRDYAGGTIATWYKKVILTMDRMPADWYRWHGSKLKIDYLLIDEKWLDHIAIIAKALDVKTLVIYGKQGHALHNHRKVKPLGMALIWLKPAAKKILSWDKNV